MTSRERAFMKLGIEYTEDIEHSNVIVVPKTGREVRKTKLGWECQPWNDNYWIAFSDLLEALKFASPPTPDI